MPIVRTWEGRSKKGFEQAAEAAAKKAESYFKRQRKWRPPLKLRVVDMYVTVTNPIGDYIVVLGAESHGGRAPRRIEDRLQPRRESRVGACELHCASSRGDR